MLNKESFIKDFERNLFTSAGKDLTQADHRDLYYTLGNLVREYTGKPWADTNKLQEANKAKSVYYFSMEFLTGKFMQKYLEYLGIYEIAREYLADNDICIADVFDVEPDPGLGNGGLGRLAAAFLDSLSCLGMPGHGYGLRYEKGLFRQKIVNGYQVEEADNWLAEENVWEYQRPSEELEVRFGGRIDVSGFGDDLIFTHVDYDTVKAVPYDTPVIGYLNGNVNTLRLWSAVSIDDLDFGEYAKGNLDGAFHRINEAKSICQLLYPDDTYYEGKKLRLKQEYFLVSAGVQDIVRKFKKLELPIMDFHKYVQIHINDTHPVMAIPELMRILMDSYGLEWNEAWEITVKTCAFTNHTIMEEAMEKWDNNLYRDVIPRIWQITEEINNRFLFTLREEKKISAAESIDRLSIINHGTVRMVNLAIAGSHSINGVARLHSDILKNRELKHFYDIYPEKFNNKTNGIIHRYWLMTSNPELSDLIEELIGDRFKKDPLVLRELLKYSDDHEVLRKISSIKHINKQKLARYIYDTKGIKVNPYSIFDVQVKRIHEYKRQL
ncbi:MAG: glycogen/starch/alpha-glucan phosphorylase, partial [Eubacteriaceae bacterium]|nr:glycogen/starch/alpha-glucan phosphorylase [Eubacteriaceae bacterium]